MRDIGWSLINQLQGFCFEHKPKKFLVRFCLEDDGFSVEAVVQENFIWCKFSEAFVTKDQTIVNISDVSNEQMMIGEDLPRGPFLRVFMMIAEMKGFLAEMGISA